MERNDPGQVQRLINATHRWWDANQAHATTPTPANRSAAVRAGAVFDACWRAGTAPEKQAARAELIRERTAATALEDTWTTTPLDATTTSDDHTDSD